MARAREPQWKDEEMRKIDLTWKVYSISLILGWLRLQWLIRSLTRSLAYFKSMCVYTTRKKIAGEKRRNVAGFFFRFDLELSISANTCLFFQKKNMNEEIFDVYMYDSFKHFASVIKSRWLIDEKNIFFNLLTAVLQVSSFNQSERVLNNSSAL